MPSNKIKVVSRSKKIAECKNKSNNHKQINVNVKSNQTNLKVKKLINKI